MLHLTYAVGLLSLVAAASSVSVNRRASDPSYAPTINASAVLDVPHIVKAGEDTLVHFNFSNSVLAKNGFQFLEIFASAWPRDVIEGDWQSTQPSYYCLLEQCIATNLTTIALNIPADILPDIRMRVSYNTFLSNKVSYNSWGDQSTQFNLTGGKGVLSKWEHKNGFDAIGHWVTRLPCTSVLCARKCIEKYLDVDLPLYSQTEKSLFRSCVQSCPGIHEMGDYRTRTCVMVNATKQSANDDGDDATTTNASELGETASATATSMPASTTTNNSAGTLIVNTGITGMFMVAMAMSML